MELRFVTGNAGKLAELQALVAPLGHKVVGDDRGYPEIQAETLAEVTEAGAQHLLTAGLKPPFLLEDSGLFISALRGFPGVYSRHALESIGCKGVLALLRDVEVEMRTAVFQTHLMYVDGTGKLQGFSGTCRGRIADRPAGHAGFGFDPIFIPVGEARTFAEMTLEEKSKWSHRGQAVRAFVSALAKSVKT